jgi:PAS domain S-box-containing protein
MQTAIQVRHAARARRIYLIAAIVAAIAIAGLISGDVALSRRYAAAGERGDRWAARMRMYHALDPLVAAVNAPGNDIFSSGDVAAERVRLAVAVAAFDRAYGAARADLRRTHPVTSDVQRVAQSLAKLDALNREVAHAGERIFALLEKKEAPLAAAQMAFMDRRYAEADAELSRLDEMTAAMKDAASHEQSIHSRRLAQFQYGIGVLLATGLLGAVLYSRGVAKTLAWNGEREQMLEVVRAREAELRRMSVAFEASTDGIAAVSWNGRLTSANRAFAAQVGATPEELVGVDWLALVTDGDRTAMQLAHEEMLRSGRGRGEVARSAPDGTITRHEVTMVASRDEHGAIDGHYQFSRDITAQHAAIEALRRSETRFALATRATNDVVWDWDLDGDIVWFNDAWQRQLGYDTRGDFDVSGWLSLVHAEDRERISASIEEAIQGQTQFWSGEYRILRSDGTYAIIFDRGYIVRDADGSPRRMIGAMMDITERTAAQQALERMSRETQLILNSATIGILGVDRSGVITFVNGSAAAMLGRTAAAMVGEHIHGMMHVRKGGEAALWTSQDCSICSAIHSSTTTVCESAVFQTRDGDCLPVEYSSSPLLDQSGQSRGAVITFRDVTERLAVERAKNEFISVVSHELRTPLTSIRGALGLLAGGRVGVMPEKSKRMIDIALFNTERLVRLINDILDIERIDSGRMELDRNACPVSELFTCAADGIRALADEASIELRIEPSDAVVWGDADRLIQTITNLTGNAIKFSPPGSAVSLSARTEGSMVVFEVADQGRGIPPENLEMIFERFREVDASDSREKGGSGLGLAICRSIVVQHGGAISVQSELEKGSRFRFTIPRAMPEKEPTLAPLDHDERGLILICEDDASLREVMCVLLESRGYRVRAFASGSDLVRGARSVNAELILIDLFMPQMNGWETLARLRADPATADIPAVVVSVLSREETTPPFEVAGWVEKPLHEGQLMATIEAAINGGGRQSGGRGALHGHGSMVMQKVAS